MEHKSPDASNPIDGPQPDGQAESLQADPRNEQQNPVVPFDPEQTIVSTPVSRMADEHDRMIQGPIGGLGSGTVIYKRPESSGDDDDAAVDASTAQVRADADREASDRAQAAVKQQDSRGSSTSRHESSVRGSVSQIWHASRTGYLDDIVTMRSRSVSGFGQFSKNEDADFEILEQLAEGGMGVVYVAKQKSLNRELAIKTLRSAPGRGSRTMRPKEGSGRGATRADLQRREMFISEALVTANLVHPNIIPIHELAQTDDGVPYYVMKRVHGIPWSKQIQMLSVQENLDVLHKVCDAVAYAHHNGVINRDLKPENIMLGEFGEVLVLDWGLAVPAPHAVTENFRSPVASFGAGTPAYMAPELWTGPATAIGEWSDVYLLGAILYEIVTGRPPHDFSECQTASPPADPWKSIDGILRENRILETPQQGELLEIALKAMRTDPQERFGSVLELQFAIRNFQRHEESRRLSTRAEELIGASSVVHQDYHNFQTAAALFEESLRLWSNNPVAARGLTSTRLRYALLAREKGDYDLGLQVAAQEDGAEFVTLATQLKAARRLRSGLKWTTVSAFLCIALLGARSIYDNGIITDLNSEVAARQQEAQLAIDAARDAETAAETAQSEADQSRASAAAARLLADTARQEAETAAEAAVRARMDAADANRRVASANAEAEEANLRVTEAVRKVAAAEASEIAAVARQQQAESAARIAQVEISTEAIRGLTLNENYSDALREIERLLQGSVLPQLPETIRQQRTTELQAQRAQLLKRARQTEIPVQSQVLSPDFRWLAVGDANGLVTVMQNPQTVMSGDSAEWPQQSAFQQQVNSSVSELAFADSDTLLIASGQALTVWRFNDASVPRTLDRHEAPITGLDTQSGLAITGDAEGLIVIWDVQTQMLISELRVNTQLCDVALIPDSRMFVYAGSRGGQSSDILAYRLPESTDDPRPRPIRLGQLRMPRSQTDPPGCLSVSPDGACMMISSSVDGDLLVLPRRIPVVGDRTDEFPFQHPADLENAGERDWLVRGHRRPVNDIGWSADGKSVLTSSDDRTIGVWSLDPAAAGNATPQLHRKHILPGHGARVIQACFLDGQALWIASSSADRFQRLWNLNTLDQDRIQIRRAFQIADDESRQAASLFRQRSGKYLLTRFTEQPQNAEAGSDDHVVLHQPSAVHRGAVRTLRFSKAGEQLASGAADGSVVLWKTNTYQPLTPASAAPDEQHFNQPRMSHEGLFRAGHEFNLSGMQIVGLSGTLLATAGFDGSLRLWNMDLHSGRAGVQLRALDGLGLVNQFATSSDGKLLLTSAIEQSSSKSAGTCVIWQLGHLQQTAVPRSLGRLSGLHRSEITAIAVAGNQRLAATGGRDGLIGIWSLDEQRLLTFERAHAKNTIISALHWLDDQTLISAGLDGKLSRWLLTPTSSADSPFELKLITNFRRDRTPVESAVPGPDGRQLLTITVETDRHAATRRFYLDLWSIDQPPSFRRISLATRNGVSPRVITSVDWSTDGQRVVVCADGALHLLETTTWTTLKVVRSDRGEARKALFASKLSESTGRDLVVTADRNAAHLWDLNTGAHLTGFHGPSAVSGITIMQQNETDLLLTAGDGLAVFDADLLHADFGRPLYRSSATINGRMLSLDVCPQVPGRFVTSGSDGKALLWQWNPESRVAEVVQRLWSVSSPIVSARCSPRDATILLVTQDARIALVNGNGRDLRILNTEQQQGIELTCGEFSNDGGLIAVAGQRIETGESIGWVFSVPEQSPKTDQVDPATDEKRHTGDVDRPLPVRPLCRFSGHAAGGITAVGFVPSSPYLISGGTDGALIIWNWQQPLPDEQHSAYEAFRFMADDLPVAHQSRITAVAVSQKNLVASAGDDGTVILWSNPLHQVVLPEEDP